MRTDQNVIDLLAADTVPVRVLPSPLIRLVRWLGVSLPFVAMMVVIMSIRPDLAEKFGEGRYVLEQGAALVTAVLAGFAAFCVGVPGRSRWVLLLPLLSLAVWLGSLGDGCLAVWLHAGSDGLTVQPDWECLPAIAMTGAVPAIAMAIMLRRGAPLAPRTGVLLGALAAAALGNVGLRLYHPQDVSLMVLVWQFGSVVLLSALCGSFGSRLLRWRLPHGRF
jgi:hypothetical protein